MSSNEIHSDHNSGSHLLGFLSFCSFFKERMVAVRVSFLNKQAIFRIFTLKMSTQNIQGCLFAAYHPTVGF